MKFSVTAAYLGTAMSAQEIFRADANMPALFGHQIFDKRFIDGTSYFDFPAKLIAVNGLPNDTEYDHIGTMLAGKKATLVVNVASY